MLFYDTCSLLDDYQKVFKDIIDNPFVISNITFTELEQIKDSRHKDDDIKYKARQVSNLLCSSYGKYKIVNYNKDWDETYLHTNPILLDNNDSRILISAYVYQNENPDVIFTTKDISCYNLAKAIGVTVLQQSSTIKTDSYCGYVIHQCVTDDELSDTYNKIYSHNNFGLIENQYLILKQNNDIIDTYICKDNELKQIQFNSFKSKMFGEIKPLDTYQKLAIDSLKNNTITMLRGAAGTGKSYLALGCLFDFLENNRIDKIVIFCNTVATAGSAKLGYYPGSRTEKLLDSQIGNFLISKLGDRSQVERMISDGQLILLPMSDIRGFDTSGMNAGVYITEAQNLNIELMKLALQRIGDDAICILDGDSQTQVDLGIYAGKHNGMRRVSEIFRGQSCYGEITLPICHRSKIANIAEKM